MGWRCKGERSSAPPAKPVVLYARVDTVCAAVRCGAAAPGGRGVSGFFSRVFVVCISALYPCFCTMYSVSLATCCHSWVALWRRFVFVHVCPVCACCCASACLTRCARGIPVFVRLNPFCCLLSAVVLHGRGCRGVVAPRTPRVAGCCRKTWCGICAALVLWRCSFLSAVPCDRPKRRLWGSFPRAVSFFVCCSTPGLLLCCTVCCQACFAQEVFYTGCSLCVFVPVSCLSFICGRCRPVPPLFLWFSS